MKALCCVFSLLTVFLSGCTLTHLVNEKWPPVTESQQRQIAVDSTAKALVTLTAPTIAAGMNLSDAELFLSNKELSQRGVTTLRLEGTQQLLKISIDFHHQFVENDAGTNEDIRKVIATWKPDITGTIIIYAGLKNPDIQAINLAAIPAMDLQVLPTISTVHVNDIKIFGKYHVGVLVEPIVGLLNIYKDDVSGVISRSKIATISLPGIAIKPLNLGRSFDFQVGGQAINTTVSANPIPIPYQLTDVAWRIADNQVTILFQVLPKPAEGSPQEPLKNTTFNDINDRFNAMLSADFNMPTSNASAWVAVNKKLLAAVVENTVAAATPCVDLSVPNIDVKPYEHMISILPSGANCRQDPTNCDINCALQPDSRSCGGNFFAKKRCQAEKDLVNGRITAEFGACKAGAAAKKAVCTTGQAATQASCEALKQSFNGLIAGEVGNLTATVSGNAQAHLCVSRLTMADDLTKASVDLTASGQANANFSVGFDPRRAAGHAICVAPVLVKNGATVDVEAPQWSASSPVALKQIGNAVFFQYQITGDNISVSFTPSLPSLLLRDTPNITLHCPIPGAAVQAADITGFVMNIPNQFSLPVPTLAGSQEIPMPTLTLGTDTLDLTLLPPTSEAIVLQGKLKENPH